jgi:S-adenosylmethionine:tRNA ribosyltransferase-isomerase
MKKSEFYFDLPEQLIAQYPPEKRGQSRLMTLDRLSGGREHTEVCRLPDILCGEKFLSRSGEKPLLVFNDTKVRKARLAAFDEKTGAQTEFLLLDDINGDGLLWKVMAKRTRRKKAGNVFLFPARDEKEKMKAVIHGFEDEYLLLEFEDAVNDVWLEKNGHIPLPPYIKRKDVLSDSERYQTIYAKQTGSTAAPTAGLHFTREILDKFNERGIESVFVTLNVGLGTFLPVRSENIEDHKMHSEKFNIDEKTALKVEKARKAGQKIIAVGTTSVRTLESAWIDGKLKCGKNSTSIFIYPGYKFKVVDALFTNFHTPESTLLMLVSAFAGREMILESYVEAVREEYRFFSYGDAMLIF